MQKVIYYISSMHRCIKIYTKDKLREKRGGKGKMKEQKGITLIALVITIIVLLILAGVSIATLTGEDGILAKAKLAKERNEQAEQEENEILK